MLIVSPCGADVVTVAIELAHVIDEIEPEEMPEPTTGVTPPGKQKNFNTHDVLTMPPIP